MRGSSSISVPKALTQEATEQPALHLQRTRCKRKRCEWSRLKRKKTCAVDGAGARTRPDSLALQFRHFNAHPTQLPWITAIFPIQTGFLDPPLPSASAESLSRHSLCAGTAGSMAPNATYLPVSLVSLAGVEVRVRKNYRDEGTVSALYLFFKRVGKVATCLRGVGIFAAVCPAYGPEGEGRFEALLLIVEWAAICASNLQLKLADKQRGVREEGIDRSTPHQCRPRE